jgi:hypothetical protein
MKTPRRNRRPLEKMPKENPQSQKSAGRMGRHPHDPLTTTNFNGVDHG